MAAGRPWGAGTDRARLAREQRHRAPSSLDRAGRLPLPREASAEPSRRPYHRPRPEGAAESHFCPCRSSKVIAVLMKTDFMPPGLPAATGRIEPGGPSAVRTRERFRETPARRPPSEISTQSSLWTHVQNNRRQQRVAQSQQARRRAVPAAGRLCRVGHRGAARPRPIRGPRSLPPNPQVFEPGLPVTGNRVARHYLGWAVDVDARLALGATKAAVLV